MNRYLFLLNWVLALLILVLAVWLAPLVGGWPLIVGMVVGGMITAGHVTMEYQRDESPDKDWKWRRSYFRKDYKVELMTQLAFVGVCAICGSVLWRGFFLFWMGVFGVWFLNYLIEYIWALTHRYYNN